MVYLHVPFCRSFCTYCDFYSEIACRGRDSRQIGAYADGVLAEIAARRDEIEATRALNTFYIGGGTPSVLPLSVLGRLVDAVGGGPFEEFTLEANPEDIVENGEEYVRGLMSLGVNRVSIGVQSLDESILKWMNRRHSAEGAKAAFKLLEPVGNVSVDVIFGLTQLSLEVLSETLDEIISWGPQHISAYQLCIEEGSALGEMVRDGRYTEAPDELCAGQYSLICRKLREAGYRHYEISNWALPGYEAKHNSAYWSRLPYVGLGPGAHSFDGERRSWNSQSLSGWTSTSESLTPQEVREERVMLGLRTSRGIPASLCDPDALSRLLDEGALEPVAGASDPFVRIPEDRLFVSDEIISELI